MEAVITDCATCGSFLKGYVNLLKDDPDYCERAQVFSDKVKDISEFLVETVNLKYDFAGLNDSVTYHESCHLLWAQQVSQQPRRILGLIPGLEFVDMKNADSCCGGAGSYNLTHYEKSMSILERKMKNVIDTGANLIATGCPGCRLQLRLGVKQRNLNIQVVHPVELLDRAYKK